MPGGFTDSPRNRRLIALLTGLAKTPNANPNSHSVYRSFSGVFSLAELSAILEMSLRHISRVCLRAVQGLRDHNSKTMIKPPQAKPRSESDHPTHPRKFSGVVEPEMTRVDGVDKRRLREAEKADQLFHLVYWGPN